MEHEKRNDALATNYPGSFIDFAGGTAQGAITVRGSDWYWAVTAIMMVSTIIFLVLGYMKPRSKRIFHYITASITMVASIAYFTMASNIGWAPTANEFVRSGNVAGLNRQIFYVRYIDWFVTTPLLLMDLLLTAGIPWPTLLYVILCDIIMVVTGLIGALVRSSYKFGYFTFGCLALFYIGYVLLWEARLSAKRLGDDVGKTFLICGSWTFAIWMFYPIAWGVCEGGNVIASDSEAVFYGILDILAKPVFGALLLWGHRGIDPARLGLDIQDKSARYAAVKESEKAAGHAREHHSANGASDGVTHTETLPGTHSHGHTGTNTGHTGTNTIHSGTNTGYTGTNTGYTGTNTGYTGTNTGNTGSVNPMNTGNTGNINPMNTGNTNTTHTGMNTGNTSSINPLSSGNTGHTNPMNTGNTSNMNPLNTGNTNTTHTGMNTGNTSSINPLNTGNNNTTHTGAMSSGQPVGSQHV